MIIIVLGIIIALFLFAGLITGVFKEELNLDMDSHGGCIVILGIIIGLFILSKL